MTRTKTATIALIFVFVVSLIFSTTITARPLYSQKSTNDAPYVQDEIVVKFKPGVNNKTIAKLNSRHRTSIRHTSRLSGIKKLRIPKGRKVQEMVETYNRNSNVEFAEPNYLARASMIPNDTYYRYQWHMDDTLKGRNPYGGANGGGINVEPAWDLSTGSGVVVAAVDTGVAYQNYSRYGLAPDLANTSFWINSREIPGNGRDDDGNGYKDDVNGWDFINNDNRPNDDVGHGTHVTGTIAQSTNNGRGVAGVAFDATIMPVKVLDNTGWGTYSQIADGIRYAARNGAKVINLSLGGTSPSQNLQSAVAEAHNSFGATIIAAVGNSSYSITYPAAYDNYVIAVGATRYDETRASYSGRGTSLDLMAPGGDLGKDQNGDGYGDGVLQQTFSGTPTNWGYWFYQGTSMACGHVSGVAALLTAYGTTGPDNIRNILQTTAEDKESRGWDRYYGWGIVDAYAALKAAKPAVPNRPPEITSTPVTTATANKQYTYDVEATDPDVGDRLAYSLTTAPSGMTIHSTTGLIQWTPSISQLGDSSVRIKVADASGASDTQAFNVTVTATSSEITVFSDSFESGYSNQLWDQDRQNDWVRSTQRAIDGRYSAQVDGYASDAGLISVPVDLQGRTNATITFSWYIETGLDTGEYLAFDVSTNGGATVVERARLRGNVDQEETWHSVSIDLTNISSLRIRFRGNMSLSSEDANVDNVRIVAW